MGWRDRLTAFGDEKFEYDVMGRPTLYRGMKAEWNGDGTLKSLNGITFSYDIDGVRKACSKDGRTTEFTYDGTRIIRRKSPSHDILFRYANGTPVGVCIDGAEFLYAKDARGSVVAMVDKDGNIVARYAYDAWGCPKVFDAEWNENSDSSFAGNVNPIRYKSYLYDSDIGLYYLITRYYDPEPGRFVSPDTLKVLDDDYARINGLNLYAYCGNDPVGNEDPEGEFFLLSLLAGALFAGLIGAVTNVASNVVTDLIGFTKTGEWNKNWAMDYAGSFLGGFVGGAITTFLPGLGGSIIGGAVSAGISNIFSSSGESGFNFKSFISDVFLGGFGGMVGYGAGKMFPKNFLDNHTIAKIMGDFPLSLETISTSEGFKMILKNAFFPATVISDFIASISKRIFSGFYEKLFEAVQF